VADVAASWCSIRSILYRLGDGGREQHGLSLVDADEDRRRRLGVEAVQRPGRLSGVLFIGASSALPFSAAFLFAGRDGADNGPASESTVTGTTSCSIVTFVLTTIRRSPTPSVSTESTRPPFGMEDAPVLFHRPRSFFRRSLRAADSALDSLW